MPSYASFEFPMYTFAPTRMSELGSTTLRGVVKNKYGQISFKLNLFVDNEPPKFKFGNPQDQKVEAGTKVKYKIPETYDRENLPVSIVVQGQNTWSLPSFI